MPARGGTGTWDSRNREYLQKEGSNCDNRLRSGKPRHVYCRTFESAEHWFDVFLVSMATQLPIVPNDSATAPAAQVGADANIHDRAGLPSGSRDVCRSISEGE